MKNKRSIDLDCVRKMLRSQFPEWADLEITPVEKNGWDNDTFHLGNQMSIRLPSAECYASQVEKEHYWLPKLAPHLPLSIPTPLAMGLPVENYKWPWSIYSWIEGHTAEVSLIEDLSCFARDLANFLRHLHACDATNGPVAGIHNFHRGGSLAIYDREARQAIEILGETIDVKTTISVWEAALATTWHNAPLWVHGDISLGNLLIKNGRLSSVIDFGCLGVGDPACDLAIAWTVFSGKSRDAFRAAFFFDNATWRRGRGWALWKALIVCAGVSDANSFDQENSKSIIQRILDDYKNDDS